MRRAINTSVKLFSESFAPAGPVVELGSRYASESESLCNLRPYFDGLEYIGCDIRTGPGVNRIEDAQALGFPDNSVGTLILLEILEHLPRPERAIMEAQRVLREDGLVVLSVPFSLRLHGFPMDYWRFTASGIHVLLSDFPDKIIFSLGPRVKPALIFAVASKSASSEFAERKRLFQKRVQEYFQNSKLRGRISVLKDRSKDFFGYLLGRAGLSTVFFVSSQDGPYLSEMPLKQFPLSSHRSEGQEVNYEE